MDLFLDLRKFKKITLGGTLLIKAECDLLYDQSVYERCLMLLPDYEIPKIYIEILNMIVAPVKVVQLEPENAYLWPTYMQESANPDMHSFSRIENLYDRFMSIPKLTWPEKVLNKAIENFDFKNKKNIFLHLREINTESITDSNTNWTEWLKFFEYVKKASPNIQFHLMGDDEFKLDLNDFTNISSLNKNFSLIEQFYLLNFAYGFIGTASGVCTAANLSRIPYVVFKHPLHHHEEMEKELGIRDCFNFSAKNQKIYRVEQTVSSLIKALLLIIESYES